MDDFQQYLSQSLTYFKLNADETHLHIKHVLSRQYISAIVIRNHSFFYYITWMILYRKHQSIRINILILHKEKY